MKSCFKLIGCAIFFAMLCAVLPTAVLATPGDTLARIFVPVPSPTCCGIGIAVDCEGNLFYTNSFSDTLYKMDKTGLLLDKKPLTDAATGASISFGAISWDKTRNKIWAGTDNSGNPALIYLIDPATGVSTFRFSGQPGCCGFTDGIAYDGSDNTIWHSDDVADSISHYDTSGTYLGSIRPKDAAGNFYTTISGHVVGKGNIMYVGLNGLGTIVTVDKTTGDFISSFTTIGGRDEDLECDVINFAPLEVLWSKDAYDNSVYAIEVETGTCICAGEPTVITVNLDIKPTSCPNPFNMGARGVLPVAILGTADFDVSTVDPATLLLEGVAPLRWDFEDVATPVGPDADSCECTTLGADGYMDLTLKFDRPAIAAALGPVSDREVRVLTLTGMTYDSTEIEGQDCVIILLKKGSEGSRLFCESGEPLKSSGVASGAKNDIVFSQTVFSTDFVVAGVGGMRDEGDGDITLAGVSGTVTEAYLYWNGPTNSVDPNANANGFVNGNPVSGTNIGFSNDNCWGYLNSQAYRADLTALVIATGNGVYTLTGFGAGPDVNSNGASLIVFFDDGDETNDRDVAVFEGNDSNIPNPYDADGWNVTLAGINYDAGTANMQLHVADGQEYPDDALMLNALVLDPGPAIFQGNSVPSDNNGPINNGNLWDIKRYDITAFLTPGPNTLSLTTGVNNDCLGLVVAIIDLPAFALAYPVAVDIKPTSCPNPFNMNAKGVLPVAILGTADFDVMTVDPSTVLLEGVAPLRWAWEDVSTPVEDPDECECTTLGADGYMDLTLKFDRQAIATALGPVSDGEVLVLTLTGFTYDGEAIKGKDCVIIIKKGPAPISLAGREPSTISLGDAYPNPFNPETDISFSLPERAQVSLVIYNILGEKVKTLVNGEMPAGTHTAHWNSRDEAGNPVASGIYFYKLTAGEFTQAKRLTLIK